jgi:AcrR family transcriptional regulator
MPAAANRKRHPATDQRRNTILRAALDSFVELGVDATTVGDIRDRSGASIGSIYHHFNSKEGVAAAVYTMTLGDYHDGLLACVRKARTARAVVRGIVHYHIDWTIEHADYARFLIEMRRAESTPSAHDDIRAMNRKVMEEVSEKVKGFAERGALVKLPERLYGPVMIGPAQELIRRWLAGDRGRLTVDELTAAKQPLADAAWAALKGRS